ncbi:MAG: DUF4265 domain-containing protein [Bacteroidota bacterium]
MNRSKHVKVIFRHEAFEGEGLEGAWCLKKEAYYQLDNILFYAKNFALNDIFEVEEINEELYASNLVKESGHSCIRILFDQVNEVSKTRATLKKMGCDSELSNMENLIAIDIPPNVVYATLTQFLDKGEEEERWQYQEAAISTFHREQTE